MNVTAPDDEPLAYYATEAHKTLTGCIKLDRVLERAAGMQPIIGNDESSAVRSTRDKRAAVAAAGMM